MPQRLTSILAAATVLAALAASSGPAAAEPQAPSAQVRPVAHVELTNMMGRWYEVARFPNQIQRGCQAGASEWTRTADGFAVVQSCHKGTPDGPLAEWKAKARVADPATNAKFKMSFFGGLVSQEYWVLEQRTDQGWLILATHDGHYLWLMSNRPTLPMQIRTEAVQRIKALGFDTGRLEFPLPGRG
jgi:apolipoprotein D and lipocalin family protein